MSMLFISLIQKLKEESETLDLLKEKQMKEKNPHRAEVRKNDLIELKKKIEKLLYYLDKECKKLKEKMMIIKNIKKEKRKEVENEEKSKKFENFIKKARDKLIEKIPYYQKLQNYSNKKIKTVKLSPLDLINFTLRLSQQNAEPPSLYFENILPTTKDPPILYKNYYLMNKNRFIFAYPDDYFGLRNTILRYDFSEKRRLLPPELDATLNENGEYLINSGLLGLKYPGKNEPQNVYYKYSLEPDVIPSFFTGQKFANYNPPHLKADCNIKVCTCGTGFKDSKIKIYKLIINNKTDNVPVVIKNNVNKKNELIRPIARVDCGEYDRFRNLTSTNSNLASVSRHGTSTHIPNYYQDNNEDDDSDDNPI